MDTFLWDNVIHILAGCLVILCSTRIAAWVARNMRSKKSILAQPFTYGVLGVVWAAWGIITIFGYWTWA